MCKLSGLLYISVLAMILWYAFLQCTSILKQICNNANLKKHSYDNLMNSHNIVNITKYITVNIKTSFKRHFYDKLKKILGAKYSKKVKFADSRT